LLIAMRRHEVVHRHLTLEGRGSAHLARIPAEKLASTITSYTIGFSVAHHIAETITRLHGILTTQMNKLHETERIARDLSRTYVDIIQFIEQEGSNQHLPWLFSLLEKGKQTAAYNFGLSLAPRNEEKPIDVSARELAQYRQTYPRGATICKEGEKAEEMFILMQGKIEVRINNNPIDMITRKGTIIGEMGLILGTPRTATLRALEDVTMVKIGSGDMETIFKNDPNTFLDMLCSLALREADNSEKIREYSEMVEKISSGRGELTLTQVDEYAKEFSTLAVELEKLTEANPRVGWLGQARELSHRKAAGLLVQASSLTGEVYELTASTVTGEAVPRDRRPVRDTSIPKIDWF
jgi:CRP-like cAMP-binding protein